jgi:hypothetical protein
MLDVALIEIEQNVDRADADYLEKTVSRMVGQLAAVEWILQEEGER